MSFKEMLVRVRLLRSDIYIVFKNLLKSMLARIVWKRLLINSRFSMTATFLN